MSVFVKLEFAESFFAFAERFSLKIYGALGRLKFSSKTFVGNENTSVYVPMLFDEY